MTASRATDAPWAEAVSALSGGTDRNRLASKAPAWMAEAADPSGDLLARLGWLATAVAVTPLHVDAFAGFDPADGAEAAEAALPGQGASARLCALLPDDGTASPMLPDWLSHAAARSLTVPPEMLPALLALPAGSVPAAVMGPWAGWAARIVSALSGDAEPDVAAPSRDRVPAHAAWLADEPAEARASLLDGFRAKPADERADIVSAFEARAVPDDEAFLDGCLDDRSERVRSAAARALATMEGSGYRLRMHRLVREGIRPVPDPRGGSRLTLADPGVREANRRDGVRSEGLAALCDATRTVPPSTLGHVPGDVVDAAARVGWGVVALESLAASSCRWRDAACAEAVAAAAIALCDGLRNEGAPLADVMADCWGVMPPARVAAQILSLGDHEAPRHDAAAIRALVRHGRRNPLPPGVSRVVVRWALRREGLLDRQDAVALALACELDDSVLALALAASDGARERGFRLASSTAIADTLGLRLAILKDFDP